MNLPTKPIKLGSNGETPRVQDDYTTIKDMMGRSCILLGRGSPDGDDFQMVSAGRPYEIPSLGRCLSAAVKNNICTRFGKFPKLCVRFWKILQANGNLLQQFPKPWNLCSHLCIKYGCKLLMATETTSLVSFWWDFQPSISIKWHYFGNQVHFHVFVTQPFSGEVEQHRQRQASQVRVPCFAKRAAFIQPSLPSRYSHSLSQIIPMSLDSWACVCLQKQQGICVIPLTNAGPSCRIHTVIEWSWLLLFAGHCITMHGQPPRDCRSLLDGFLSLESSHPIRSQGCNYYRSHANHTELR
ncbi:hypothetical protein SLEP1_g15320 [Rubroshorea leprosula]|uniref:Uncharacterized protein n=1 Tax=Rubroshorea leprosula TaxID=152421 RepID=A0AAV5IM02_9ROSI|nr:hypothetical protein SLEP1_g15320 [Rubroshorea leprosula]